MKGAERIEPVPESWQTAVHVQRFAVPFEYPVYFTRHVFDPGNAALVQALSRLEPHRRQRLVAFVDDGLARHRPGLAADIGAYAAVHGERLELLGAPHPVPGGEAAKNDPALVQALHRRLRELGVDRHAHVLAVGGGAMLDAVGYAAATAHRGVRLVRVPSTVLAQNDSGVGVKNGVNAFGVKNWVGTFAPPFAVLNDFELLASLEPRDRVAGMAEAVKVALIRDRAFFEWMEANARGLADFEAGAAEHLIRRCAELHLAHIGGGGDPFEAGSARPLDFGHWAAHKLEGLSGHALRHGEAVAIGMALDTRYSVQTGTLRAAELERICALLERLGFRLWHPALARAGPALLAGLDEFREHLGGELTLTLLAGIGAGVEVHAVDRAQMAHAVDWLARRDAGR